MTRHSLVRLSAVGALLTFAFPLASYANAPGPIPAAHPVTPSDTLAKLDRAKTERPAPAPRKKLKASRTAPAPAPRQQYVPDQPWETEFFVENDISGRRAIQLALASFEPRR